MSNKIICFQTNYGDFKAEMFEDKAPITTENFLNLVEKDFYNGVIFHRVIEDFMIQGGDPTGTGMGGPGYNIKDEFHPELRHTSEGLFSMANAGPNTGGSQFFITLAATPWLDGRHAIFGKIIDGMDVIKKIASCTKDLSDRPTEDIIMEKVFLEK